MLSDADIMTVVQAGEVSLFAELVARYNEKLLRVASSKLAEPSAAEDVVQETFLAAYRARNSYSHDFAFSTWIWTILLNQCRRAGERARARHDRQAEYQQRQSSERADTLTAIETLVLQEEQQCLRALLAELPDEQADAIRLRFYGELSFAEIAAAMDSSINGAKRRCKHGLLRLAELIRQRET